jgi:hypothetical protein
MQTSFPSRPAAAKRSLGAVHVTLSLIILAACLLSASSWRVYSHTWDEPEHLAAGVELLDRGRYDYDTEHPPIARALMALGPWLAGAHSYGTPPPDGNGTQEGIHILYDSGHYQLYLTLARLGVLPFLAVLLFSTWLWARRLGTSAGEALLAVAMVAAVPAVLGHAALATLDSAMAATTLLALWALQRWIAQGGWREAVVLGITVGIAVGTKFSAIPFIVLAVPALALVHGLLGRMPAAAAAETAAEASSSAGAAGAPPARQGRVWLGPLAARRLGGLAVAALVAVIPIAIAYGLRSAPYPRVFWRFDRAISYLVHEHDLSGSMGALIAHMALPQPLMDFIEGIVALKAHNDTGHSSFLLGQHRDYGWWYFYIVALVVKTPIPLLIAGPVGLVLKAWQGIRERNSWHTAPLVLFVTTLGFASWFSHINIGIRHVLLLYPFLALGGAYAVMELWRRGSQALGPVARSASLTQLWACLKREPRRAPALGACLLAAGLAAWQLSTLWTAHPDYLPYFNEAVAHPEQILVDSDLDWGQDLRRLEWRLADLKVHSLNLAWIGTADLTREPLPPYTMLPPGKQVSGWVAITALAREHQTKGYSWLNAYKPIERIGRTIDLYYIPPAPEEAPPAGAPAVPGEPGLPPPAAGSPHARSPSRG